MVNRIAQYFEEPEGRSPTLDFWFVSSPTFSYCVDEPTAMRILEQLDRRWPPRWIRFRDLFGSAVRLRSRDIDVVAESTAEQRAFNRAFQQAQRDETSGDHPPPWEDCS